MGINVPRSSPEILPQNLKNLTARSLNILKEAVEKDPSREKLEFQFELGEFEKDEGLKKLVDHNSTSLLRVQASVDSTKHRQRSEKIREYAENARKIESYSKYFTPETRLFYEKNKQAILDISSLDTNNKDLHNSPEWDEILERYGDDLLDAEGALNFILAFMRATDETVLSKIDRKEINTNFSIDLFLSKGKRTNENRKAVFELRIPKELRDELLKEQDLDLSSKEPDTKTQSPETQKPEDREKTGTETPENLELNQGLLNDLERNPYFFKNNKPDRLAVLFADKNNHFQKMFRSLASLKEKNPEFFNKDPKNEKYLKLIAKGIAEYYSSFGAILPEAKDIVTEFSNSLDVNVQFPDDPISVWREGNIIEWLRSEHSFSVSLPGNARDMLLKGKNSHIRILYEKLLGRNWNVEPKNKELFKAVNQVLQDYEIYYNPDQEKGINEAAKYQFQLEKVLG
jgi:hypothetical protein